MDVTRVSLDKISRRPACSSRAWPICRSLHTSLELLTPEPCVPKVDSPVTLAASHQRGSLEDCCPEENKGDDREKSDVRKVRTDQQTIVESTTFFLHMCILKPNELSGCIFDLDSGGDSMGTQTLEFCEPSQGKLSSAKEANSSNLEYSEETDVDPQIQASRKKMNELDKILAKIHFKERAIKNKGKEKRAKLWEELQSIRTTGSQMEVENTKLFLALNSSWQDTANPSHANEDEICTSVFHTEINPEDYDCHETHHNHDYSSELERNEFLNQAENMHSKNKGNRDFIKKNVELAKDPGNQVVMLERERKRLVELLKDTEDGIEFQGLEEDLSGWLAPGEGYTPELMDFHLNEIDIKLQVLLSDGDFSAISSSCSKPPSQIYQESLVYANRSLEPVPGEKVLRDNKEQRDQQNRLKEIDHQLKSLERNLTEEQTGLSEEQLKTLLEECMQPQRTISNVTMPKSQESLSFGLSPPCYTSQDSTLHSTSTLSKMLVEDHIVGMLMAQEKAGLGDKSLCVNAESEIPGYYISKALADSHLSKDSLAQTEEPDDLEGLQKMGDKSVTEGYFMSRALNTKRLKKPSFLGEPLYCISMNNEPSTEADILSIPLQTKGGETLNNPLE
ncbi:fibrous sheath-interacting protein 1 isoform X1 [Falco naumanni]|uniref:fibrous sheath-interacting protein 1 isoform X1 n=1 Tax=Falco naumanni TaxID=148594 RepID=UPI001ADEA305|nr:fibrous sheath-interacting protein 1 isoform X1 [Falco naumanni]XP_040457739.1 fibrous sheath-interacting protein 1 isoform X1 [Falco naumanni]